MRSLRERCVIVIVFYMMKYRKIYYTISGVLVTASIGAIIFLGIPLGLDFEGGSLMELRYTEADKVPAREKIENALQDLDLGALQVQHSGDQGVILRFRDVNENTHQEVLSNIQEVSEGEFSESRFETVGPTVGEETKNKSLVAISIVVLIIIAYIAWAFRKVSYPVSSIKYGITSIIALAHDIIITLGVFSLYTHFTGKEAGIPFVVALLTILGYSVNDTIVIFDRVRENLQRLGDTISFEEGVSKSVKESLVRSLNTSLTTLIVLFAVLFFGGDTLNNFIFTLITGIVVGVYSSLFVASPLLVEWVRKRE